MEYAKLMKNFTLKRRGAPPIKIDASRLFATVANLELLSVPGSKGPIEAKLKISNTGAPTRSLNLGVYTKSKNVDTSSAISMGKFWSMPKDPRPMDNIKWIEE